MRLPRARPTNQAALKGRTSTLTNLGLALVTKFGRQGSLEDLNASIVYQREALASKGYTDRILSLNNLLVSLCARYMDQNSKADLDEAITLATESLELQPAKGHMWMTVLHNLAFALGARFGHDGRREDLDDAITYHRQALELGAQPNTGGSFFVCYAVDKLP